MEPLSPNLARVPYTSPRAYSLEDAADEAVRRLLDAEVSTTIVFKDAVCRERQVYSYLGMFETVRDSDGPAPPELYRATDLPVWEIIDCKDRGKYFLGKNGNIFVVYDGVELPPFAVEYETLAKRDESRSVLESLRRLGS